LIVDSAFAWHFDRNSETKRNCFVDRSALILFALHLNREDIVLALREAGISPSSVYKRSAFGLRVRGLLRSRRQAGKVE
jgi:hypothetical protein